MKTSQNECFAYTRVSTVKQGEGVSLQAQKEAIQGFADRNGLIVSQWLEETETAAKSGRPVFSAMIKLLRQGKAGGVIIHKIDRSARNFADWAKIGELSDSGIDVHFAAESIDFRSRGGRLTADIQAVIAADFIRNLKEETRKGLNGRLKEGIYPFRAPIGYLDMGSGNPKAIDPVRGPLLQKMYDLYATGQYSTRSLEEEMWSRGLRSVNGKRVYKSKVEEALRNLFYIGIIEIKRTGKTYPGKHEPLIDAELFARVQRIKKNKSRKKKTKHQHLFRGLFQCRACGNILSPERQRGHVYYRCHTKGCPANSVRESAINEAIQNSLLHLQLDSTSAHNFEHKMKTWISHLPDQASRTPVHIEGARIDGQLDRLTDKLLTGTIDDEIYARKKKELEIRQLELGKKQEKALDFDAQQRNRERFFEHAKSLAVTYFFASDSEKRQMLEICFSNMTIADKKPLLEPRNWLSVKRDGTSVPLGSHNKRGNRSGTDMPEAAIEQYLETINCPEVHQFIELCDQINARDHSAQIDGNDASQK